MAHVPMSVGTFLIKLGNARSAYLRGSKPATASLLRRLADRIERDHNLVGKATRKPRLQNKTTDLDT